MLVSTVSGVVIDDGMGVVILIFGGVSAAAAVAEHPIIIAIQAT